MANSGNKHSLWPPYCCVPAFAAVALRLLGYPDLAQKELAKRLGTCVGPESANPWGLPVEDDPEKRRVTAATTQERLPEVLAELDLSLRFCHVRFNEVEFGLYAEVLGQATQQGAVVGVGFDYARLFGRPAEVRHVARVESLPDDQTVRLLDDYAASPAKEATVKWLDLEPAVRAVDDGFWMIGRSGAPDLSFVSV